MKLSIISAIILWTFANQSHAGHPYEDKKVNSIREEFASGRPIGLHDLPYQKNISCKIYAATSGNFSIWRQNNALQFSAHNKKVSNLGKLRMPSFWAIVESFPVPEFVFENGKMVHKYIDNTIVPNENSRYGFSLTDTFEYLAEARLGESGAIILEWSGVWSFSDVLRGPVEMDDRLASVAGGGAPESGAIAYAVCPLP